MSRASASGAGVRPAFHGAAKAMFPVVLKGLFLTIVTLGIYRFWYISNVRRFLWNHSEVDGDSVEYTGRGVELFIGFLIALAVLAPLYGVLTLIGLVTGPVGAAALQFGSTFGLLFLAQYALYRARRYRLTRTVWRGVRFQQTGSGWAYAWRSVGWAILTVLTLGLTLPFMRASLERYKVGNTWYGDQQGAFSATAGALFKRGAALWLLTVVALTALVVSAGFLAGTLVQNAAAGAAGLNAAGAVAATVAALVLLVVLPLYLAIDYRWWAEGCSVGPATFKCDLGLFAFFKVYLGYVGVVLLFSLVVGLIGGGLAALAGGTVFEPQGEGLGEIAVVVIGAAIYFVVALVFAALWQIFGVRPIWRKSLESVVIAGLPALMAAQSAEPPANAFGEGVADALDFGGF